MAKKRSAATLREEVREKLKKLGLIDIEPPPTKHAPGTVGKIEELRKRVELGFELHVSGDSKEFDGVSERPLQSGRPEFERTTSEAIRSYCSRYTSSGVMFDPF